MSKVLEQDLAAEALAVQVGVAGIVAWRNTLVGGGAPVVRAYFERASHPRPGDLVVETSSFGLRIRDDREPHVCVGTLLREVDEVLTYDSEEGDEGGDPETYVERAVYIQPLAYPEGHEFRWTNADFAAIPRTLKESREWRGES